LRLLGFNKWTEEATEGGLIHSLKKKLTSYKETLHFIKAQKEGDDSTEQDLESAIAKASRDWRLQDDLLRKLEEPTEATEIRRRLRCRRTQATVGEALLGVGVNVQIKVGIRAPDKLADDEDKPCGDEGKGRNEDGEESGEDIEEYFASRKGDVVGKDGMPVQELKDKPKLWKVGTTVTKDDLFSSDAYDNKKAKVWLDSNIPFQCFLPLALSRKPEEWYAKAKPYFLYMQSLAKDAENRWLAADREKWVSFYEGKDEAFKRAKAPATKGGKGSRGHVRKKLSYFDPPETDEWSEYFQAPYAKGPPDVSESDDSEDASG